MCRGSSASTENMASGGEPKRRRLRYYEKGNSFDFPKSTMAHYRAINSLTSSANTELSSQSLPSTIAVHVSDRESRTRASSVHSDSEPAGSESPPGGTYDEDDELYSSSDEEHSADDTETADEGQYVDENNPPPDAMSEEEFLSAGLCEFGLETLPH